MSILLPIASFLLILLSAFLILIVLAQKAKSDGGMGAAMGGGMAEAAFGAETGNVLTKATINASVAFFILTFLLYLGQVYQHKHIGKSKGGALPTITVPATPPPVPPASLLPSAPTTTPPSTEPTPSSVAPMTVAPSAATPATSTTAPAEQPKKP